METRLLHKNNGLGINWVLILALIFFFGCNSSSNYHKPNMYMEVTPSIMPDYNGVIFPVNIATPNFLIKEIGEEYETAFGFGDTVYFTYRSKNPQVIIPEKKWKVLLQQAKGKEIFFRINIRQQREWIGYMDIKNRISEDSIDTYLSYRLIYPGYELWNEMGIYQRCLETHCEEPIIENRQIGGQCINCHTYGKNSPNHFLLHVRGTNAGTLIYKNGNLEKINSKLTNMPHGLTYATWHPNGRFIAFSMNEIQQFFHSSGKKPVEVSDLAADLGVYDTETCQLLTDSLICGNAYMETFPHWGPDGKDLYFCRAEGYKQGISLDSIRYDLYCISFDETTGSFDSLRCVYPATQYDCSVSFPRISPDGNYLLFTQSDYGTFSIWHPESDLYLLRCDDGIVRCVDELNSEEVESFHTWSSTGKWIVFSSKRQDGLWARPFFAHFDAHTGRFSKPFVLPQEDPEFYDTFTKTYNLPEFMTVPITYQEQLVHIIGDNNSK